MNYDREVIVPDCLLERYLSMGNLMSVRFCWNLSKPDGSVAIDYFSDDPKKPILFIPQMADRLGQLTRRFEANNGETIFVSSLEAEAIYDWLVSINWVAPPAPFGTGITPHQWETAE